MPAPPGTKTLPHLQDTPPRPGLRRGPRPLLLHLAMATLKSNGSASAWPNSSDNWQNLLTRLSRPEGGAAGPDAALIHGIAAYRRHPWVRDVENPPAVWSEGEASLLDYGGATQAPAVLLVPSLVNRATILDLSRDRSMARYLAASGLRVLLLDWGWPDAAARQMDLDAIIQSRLANAIAAASALTAGRITLVGYCMGGLLTLAAAQLRPEPLAGLALLATPWDFHADRPEAQGITAQLVESLEPLLSVAGTLPIDALQMMFSLGDPHGVGDKYRSFGRMAQDSARARQFVSIEDWVNDGVPLAAPVARQCLRRWYVDNAPMRGEWRVGGHAILPQQLRVPCFVAVPGRDRIVPPESAMPLAEAIKKAVLIRPAAGHVGMVAGASARTELWDKLAAWARTIPGHAPRFRKPRRAAKVLP